MEKQSTLLNLRSETNRLFLRLGQFWNWWQSELLGVLPPGIREKLQRRGQYLFAEVQDENCTVRFGPKGNLVQISSFELGESLAVSGGLTQQIADSARKADEIILLLPPEHLLNKSLTLPIATENSLDNVLKFEMDRHTPFTADQVYYGYRVASRDKQAQRIHVALVLMTRAKLDPLLQRFRGMGLNPTVVAPAAEASGDLYSVNILPKDLQSTSGKAQKRTKRWQLALLVVMLILALTVPVLRQEATVETLQAEIEVPRALAEKAQAVNEQVKLLIESRQFLVKKKNDAPSALSVLNELTQLLPDNTWLNRFELQKGSIKLQGESREASALIGIIEASENLTNARFSSPVTANPRTQKERFVIEAQLRTEAAP